MWHPDLLVNKMRLEALQILASAAHIHGFTPPTNDRGELYGKGYINHPCSQWAALTRDNYLFVCDYCQSLITEANLRGYKPKYQDKLDHCYSQAGKVPEGTLLPIPLAMARGKDANFYFDCALQEKAVTPEEYGLAVRTRHAPLKIASKFYRIYLTHGKCHYAAWRHSPVPMWWASEENAGKLYCPLPRKRGKKNAIK